MASRRDSFLQRGDRATLRRDAARGGTVSLAAQGARFVLQLGFTAVMARLLTPEDHGVFAIAMIFTMVLGKFRDGGLHLANVQAPKLTHGQATTLLLINTGIGVVLAGLIWVIAGPLAGVYEQPFITKVLEVLGLSYFVASLGVQFRGIASRQLRLVSLAVVDVFALACSVVTGIVSAKMESGVLALAHAHLALNIVAMIGSVLASRWVPTLPVPFRQVIPLVKFGILLALSSAVNQLGANADRAMLGRVGTVGATGIFTKALNLAALPLEKIAPAYAAIAIPSLSQLADQPDAYRRVYGRLVSTFTLIATPITGILFLEAEAIVLLVLGDQWGEVVPVFRWLCVGSLVLPLWNSTGWVFVSQGRGGAMLRWQLADAAVKAAAAGIAVWFGPIGLAIAFSVRYMVMVPVLFAVVAAGGVVTQRWLYVQLGWVFALIAPALGAGCMVSWLFSWGDGDAPPALAGGVFCAIYSTTVLATPGQRERIMYAYHSIRSKKRPRTER